MEGKALNLNCFYMLADDYGIMWIPTPKSHFIIAPLSNMVRYFKGSAAAYIKSYFLSKPQNRTIIWIKQGNWTLDICKTACFLCFWNGVFALCQVFPPTCSCSFVHRTRQDMVPCRTSHGIPVCRCKSRPPGCTCRGHTGSIVHTVGPTASLGTGSVPWTGRTVNCYSCTGLRSSSPSNQDCTDIALSLHRRPSWCYSSSCCCTGGPRRPGDMCICPSLGHTCPFGISKQSRS